MSTANDYEFTEAEIECLRGAVILPCEFRLQIFQKYSKTHGAAALVRMLAQFVGLANSVIVNHREWVEEFCVIEGNMHPHSAEKINTPTLSGALNGCGLAAQVDEHRTCLSCAFRKGTIANQCLPTTLDCRYAVENSERFMCHVDLDDQGNPTHECLGFAQARKAAEQSMVVAGEESFQCGACGRTFLSTPAIFA